ncbi:MAG TPA: ATP-grasp domain-containing protein [Polyangiaceae bacterium]|jgi:biotin carboxylase|nr:ATP-grasp domain-containing protein [Polyangiaceae bacterium]
MVQRLLLACPASSYRLEAFVKAAGELDIQVHVAIDQPGPARKLGCPHDRIDFTDIDASLRILRTAAPFDGVLAADEKSAVLAAAAGAELSRLSYHTPAGVEAARDKRLMRTRLRDCVAVPDFEIVPIDGEPSTQIRFPCVVKPSMLSGSQGVIRADSQSELERAVARVRRILDRHPSELRLLPEFFELLVEQYIEGDEVVVEALMREGDCEPLAIFDKPDPLVGPYFEETIYVTPSRKREQHRLIETTAAAARALGLTHGPVHAELRIPPDGRPVLIEIAARSIGGLCSRALTHVVGSLERRLVRAAVGLDSEPRPSAQSASGVMMIPVPKSGVLDAVHGIDAARAVAGVDAVEISVSPGEAVRTLPEGDRYLGFIFAHAGEPQAVEEALRSAHRALTFELKPLLALA